jgi:hypothetical protein
LTLELLVPNRSAVGIYTYIVTTTHIIPFLIYPKSTLYKLQVHNLNISFAIQSMVSTYGDIAIGQTTTTLGPTEVNVPRTFLGRKARVGSTRFAVLEAWSTYKQQRAANKSLRAVQQSSSVGPNLDKCQTWPTGEASITSQPVPGAFPSSQQQLPFSSANPPSKFTNPTFQAGSSVIPSKEESTFDWKTGAALTIAALGTAAYLFGTTGLPSQADSVVMSGVNFFGDTTCSVVPMALRGVGSVVSAAASGIGSMFGGASSATRGETSVVSRTVVESVVHDVS